MPSAPAACISAAACDDLAGVVAARAGEHRRPAGGLVDDDLDDAPAFLGGESVGASPVVPHGTRKCMPASIWRRASRRTAASSTAPGREGGDERCADAGESG